MSSYFETNKPSSASVWARVLMAAVMGSLLAGLLYWADITPSLEPKAERPALKRGR
jgi:hypothetical protein